MVSDASHELRTPLAILRTRLEVARSGEPDVERLLADLEGAERSTLRLTALVDSLLELSTIEASSPVGAAAPELIAELREAVDRAVFRAQGRAVEIQEEGDLAAGGLAAGGLAAGGLAAGGLAAGGLEAGGLAAGDAVFAIRPQDFGRAIDNLLNNSLRAVGDRGRITVSLRLGPRSLSLRVTDSGGGMPEDFVGRALDRFSQSDSARSSGNGAGLGLAIVAAIVERAHGTITLDNEPGTGLAVRIDLPGTAPASPQVGSGPA